MANITTTGASGYPGVLDTRTVLVDGSSGDQIVANHPNGLGSAVLAIETALGVTPQGSAADVVSRLNVSMNAAGNIKVLSPLLLTGGTITMALRGYLSGMTIITAASSSIATVSVGQWTDSTFVRTLTQTQVAKTTSAWAQGSGFGGLDTGSIATNTFYSFYALGSSNAPSTTDAIFSLSIATPTLPAAFDLFRYIGARLTASTTTWVQVNQDGDYHAYNNVITETVLTVGTTGAQNVTVSAPANTQVILNGSFAQSGAAFNPYLYLSDLSQIDQTPSSVIASVHALNAADATEVFHRLLVRVNASSQIRTRSLVQPATVNFVTVGYWDRRGRDQ